MVQVSVVLPAHNEALRLRSCVAKVKQELNKLKYDYEIIIAEDGSTDGTDKIAEQLAAEQGVKVLQRSPEKLGRGLALKRACAISEGKVIAFMDVDLATNIRYLRDLLAYAKEYDVVTGSRYVEGAKFKRPSLRTIISKAYNLFIRVLLGCDIKDAQCGFKAFSKNFADKVISKLQEKSWAWDTVVLVEAVKQGYSFKEFPVEWLEKRNQVTSIERTIKDVRLHGTVLLKLFLKWKLKRDIKV